jgi:hypothetical protein
MSSGAARRAKVQSWSRQLLAGLTDVVPAQVSDLTIDGILGEDDCCFKCPRLLERFCAR